MTGIRGSSEGPVAKVLELSLEYPAAGIAWNDIYAMEVRFVDQQ